MMRFGTCSESSATRTFSARWRASAPSAAPSVKLLYTKLEGYIVVNFGGVAAAAVALECSEDAVSSITAL
eukprot:13537477-Alexandrium_andersonii.AAC.1